MGKEICYCYSNNGDRTKEISRDSSKKNSRTNKNDNQIQSNPWITVVSENDNFQAFKNSQVNDTNNNNDNLNTNTKKITNTDINNDDKKIDTNIVLSGNLKISANPEFNSGANINAFTKNDDPINENNNIINIINHHMENQDIQNRENNN